MLFLFDLNLSFCYYKSSWGDMMYNNLFIGKNLEEPLSSEELIECIKKAKVDKKVRDEVISRNIKLVLNIVSNSFYTNVYEKEDLVSVGLIGLIKAVDTFDVNKEIAFSTYARVCIINHIIKYMRANNKHYNFNLSFDNDDDLFSFWGSLTDENVNIVEDYEDKELNENIRLLIADFPLRDRMIMELYFGLAGHERLTETQIAAIYNVSRTRIGQIIKKNIDYIRRKLGIMYKDKTLLLKKK